VAQSAVQCLEYSDSAPLCKAVRKNASGIKAQWNAAVKVQQVQEEHTHTHTHTHAHTARIFALHLQALSAVTTVQPRPGIYCSLINK
jgi:hypothetical protein